MIQFIWAAAASGYTIKGKKLVAKNGKRARAVKILDADAEEMILEFAQLDESPDSIRGFADKYGLLKFRSNEPLSLWREEIKSMRRVLEAKSEGRLIDAVMDFMHCSNRHGGIMVVFGPDAAGTDLELGLMPPNLISWLWLQVGQHMKRKKVKTCKECGKFFMAGGGKGARARQSRKTQIYCSDGCRMTFNNRRLKERKKSKGEEK